MQACAEVCYSIEVSKGFKGKSFVNTEKTILGNYITKEQVFEFGRTGVIPNGANFQILYFKDENGNQTDEPAILYVTNPEIEAFGSAVKSVVDWLEGVYPGFLTTMVDNGIRIILHSQANDNKNTQGTTYNDGLYYENYSGSNSESFYKSLRKGLLTEGVGIRCDILGLSKNEQGLIKPYFALLFTQYALTKSSDDGLVNFEKFYQNETDLYTFLYADGRSSDEIKALREETKMLVYPFGGSWKEIDYALESGY